LSSPAAQAPAPAPAADAREPLLEVRKLSKDFGRLRVVSSVSFRVAEGEFVGVIGPNGAGKTTLFALLSGFLAPTEGDVRFLGRPLAGLRPDHRCHLGLARTFQIVRPFPQMTVFENVEAAAMFGKAERRTRAAVAREVEDVLELTGLARQADQAARTLSLPERKRLEVARTLATRPRLLLLDEVLAGLNPRAVEDALPFIRKVNERGVTVLMIEHNLRAIMGLSRRILVLNFGELIFDGTPQEAVKDREVVRAYLGEGAHA
jgi:ABC-type branched-subunit amino acid transport system ATPase component